MTKKVNLDICRRIQPIIINQAVPEAPFSSKLCSEQSGQLGLFPAGNG